MENLVNTAIRNQFPQSNKRKTMDNVIRDPIVVLEDEDFLNYDLVMQEAEPMPTNNSSQRSNKVAKKMRGRQADIGDN